MISADDLLAEAADLMVTADGREVRCRTVVSRSYYAAFHRASAWACANGYVFDESHGTGMHAHLIRWLWRRPEPRFREISRLLRVMKDRRTTADYRLSATVTMADAVQTARDAKRLLTSLLPTP